MESLNNLFTLLILLAPIWLIIALIKPAIFEIKSRTHAIVIFLVGLTLFFVGFALTIKKPPPHDLATDQVFKTHPTNAARIERFEEQADIDRERIKQEKRITDIKFTSIDAYRQLNRDERIAFLTDVIGLSDKLGSRDAGSIDTLKKKYGALTRLEMDDFYNEVNKRIALQPIDFAHRDLIRTISSVSAGFLKDTKIREKRDFDAIMENDYLIAHQMKLIVKSTMDNPGSFEFERIDKRLNQTTITYVLRFYETNNFGDRSLSTFVADVSIPLGEIIQ
jgi:hypothetical protein